CGAGVRAAPDTLQGSVEGIDLARIAASTRGPVSQDSLPSSDAGAIIGIEDPTAEFYVQAATFTTATDATKTAAIVDADGDRTLRQSRQSVTPDASHQQARIIGLLQRPATTTEASQATARV